MPPTFTAYALYMEPFNPGEFNRLIRQRRSTFPRQYVAGATVDDHIIHQLLENATWAPTHKMTEPWQFTVFSGKGLHTFARLQAAVYRNSAGDSFHDATYRKLLDTPLLASHIISIGVKRHPEMNIPAAEEMAAVACAVQNMWLTATAYGIGCYWTTGGITYNGAARPFFNLGNDDLLMGFLYVGVVETASPAGSRQPVAEKVNWIKE